MSQTDYIPHKGVDFYLWANNFIVTLAKIVERVEFPYPVYQQLVALTDDYKAKYTVAEAPETRTKAIVREKNEAAKMLEATLRQSIREYLTHNHLLTNADRDNLGLPVYKSSRTPSPIAEKSPDVELDTSIIGRVTFQFYDRNGWNRRKKPVGQHGAEIAWVLADAPPIRWEELIHRQTDTRSPITLVFENDRRGKAIYFAFRWVNTRGEKGPWSEIESAIIP
ncbi:MAG: hypothetical protein LBH61_03785 [Dysgonamonadaceae bacterium]|jgi:hypothetical protein|nr:hypothetical protein [Dysgonamonadaceae bacterium]